MQHPRTMKPLFESSRLGFKVALYSDRLWYKAVGQGDQTVRLDQIASVSVAFSMIELVYVETTGGDQIRMIVPWREKKKLRDAIYEAQAKYKAQSTPHSDGSVADEIAKLSQLKKDGAITQEEFDKQKKLLLDH